jgi:hypothetical protein
MNDPEFAKLNEAYVEYLSANHGPSHRGKIYLFVSSSLLVLELMPTSLFPDDLEDNNSNVTMLAQAQGVAQQMFDEVTSKKLAISIGNRKFVVRDQVRKIVKVVDTFKSVVAAAISSEPHAAIAWAGFMVIIPVG